MIRHMLSNARTTASTNNHSSDGEISINGQFYAPMDPVQDVTEISTDISKIVISLIFHPL